jgi:small ligand-binding sensory domain FIST
MRWASTVSLRPSLAQAVDEAAGAIRTQLDTSAPDLLVVFVSEHHRREYARVPDLVAARLEPGRLIGCSAGGVIGGGREVEGRPGLSMTAAVLPDVEVIPFHVPGERAPTPGAPREAWEALVGVAAAGRPQLLLLADPFSFDTERFLPGLDAALPESAKVGGLASGGREPGENALWLGRRVHRDGLVGVALTGDVALDTIVAQGCRPIGEPMFVTKCDRNVLLEVDGRRPLVVLEALHQSLDARDRELFRHSLFVGIVMHADRSEYRQGDFLIRNIMGLDPRTGALAVGALLRPGMVVQLHLRDAHTSAADLETLLTDYEQGGAAPPAGSLLFSCLGRGMHLYGRPDHDTGLFRRHLHDVPLGGFFCNGEVGPVRGTTFLHGYTSSFGLFRTRAGRSG